MSHSSHPSVHYHHDPTFDLENGMASVYLYKREGDSATEILQPFISQDPRHFRSVFNFIALILEVTNS